VEVDDLDLDASVDESVTVVEWGEGLVEGLTTDRLVLEIRRSADADDETRRVIVTPVGDRWSAVVP
jgi:tRNA threonylcarbamoyladenosine biosynthesis protein TsaE